jgi:hypothetical protein
MFSIVLGLIAVCLGIWGLVNYWWYIIDFLAAILPLLLIFGGCVAIMAGIRNTGLTAKIKESHGENEEPAAE